jgi:hypothetical protein
MTYVYEDEVDDYLAVGFSMDQLHILQFGEQRPEEPKFNQKIFDRTMDMNEVRKIVRRVLREDVTFDNNKTFTPPPNVVQRAQEALNAVSNGKLTSSGTNAGSGTSKAKELASKQTQGFDQMRRMKSYFETNQESYNSEKSSGKTIKDSGVIQAWELHGGDSGKDWVTQEMGSLNKSNLNTKKNLRLAGGDESNMNNTAFAGTKGVSTNNHRIHT